MNLGGSLQDQLLKAGLVDTKQLKKAQHVKRKTQKKQSGVKQQGQVKQRYQSEQQLKAERDRQLNQRREETARAKALNAEIKQLIVANSVEPGEEQVTYNFLEGNKVKKIHVSNETHRRLIEAKVAVVKQGGRYKLVPKDIAEKILQRDPERFVFVSEQSAEKQVKADDDYAGYDIPDDMMW